MLPIFSPLSFHYNNADHETCDQCANLWKVRNFRERARQKEVNRESDKK
jgi:hypothetical protein